MDTTVVELIPKPHSSNPAINRQLNTTARTYLTLTYTKVLAVTDITYMPEVSGDVQTWSAGSSLVTMSATNNADGATQTIVLRDAAAASGAGQRFSHLKVTQPWAESREGSPSLSLTVRSGPCGLESP